MGTYRYTGTPQFLTVSQTGDYDIVAFGAQGGQNDYDVRGGYGAEIGGTVRLSAGERLEIIVGAQGGTQGGGGGSFVLAYVGGKYVPLMIAGGGGGAASFDDGREGGAGLTSKGGFGQGGAAGDGDFGGGGGAGFKGGGFSGGGYGGANRQGFYSGGFFGGGFGGGGGSDNGSGGANGRCGGGGGGGYSGGAGGSYSTSTSGAPGQGGGSYCSGIPIASQTMAGENNGNGRVVISPEAATGPTPTVVAETGSVLAGQTVSVAAANGALKGDSDHGGGSLSVDWAAGQTLAPVPTTGSVTIPGDYGTLTINADGSYSYAATNGLAIVAHQDGSPITDTFGLYVTGSEGTLDANSSLAIGVSLAAGGAETVTNVAPYFYTFTIGATTLTLNQTVASTFNGIIQDGSSGNVGGGVVVSGSAPLTMTGVNTYTGKTSIAGTLALSGAGSIQTSTKAALTTSGATLDISGETTGAVVQKLGGVAGSTAALGSKNLKIKVQTGIVDTFSGTIKDGGVAGGTDGSLELGGPGTLILTAAESL